jgi:hypothetical protein
MCVDRWVVKDRVLKITVLSPLRRWLARTGTGRTPAGTDAVALPGAYRQPTAAWFAAESREQQTLAQATLAALAGAGPRPVDENTPRTETTATWLDTAFARLAQQPPPPDAWLPVAGLSGRYLIFTRVLCDALDAAYTVALRAGHPLRCPLTRESLPTAGLQPRLTPTEWVALDGTGLGSLIAGVWLPEGGQRQLWRAVAHDIPWPDAPAFWAGVAAQTQNAAHPGMTPALAVSAEDDERLILRDAVRDVLRGWVESEAFNRREGAVWYHEGAFFVAAKPFAERLHAQPEVRDRAEWHPRPALYRRLAAHGLLLLNGAQPVWKVYVIEEDLRYRRYVSVLKLPATLYAAIETCPAYAGRLQGVD